MNSAERQARYQAMHERLYLARPVYQPESWDSQYRRQKPYLDARCSFMSGAARVDIKIDEQCRTCRSSGQTCYRARIRTEQYDWRAKSTRLVSLRLRHLHLSPHDESRMAIDSLEAMREVARAAFSFGSYWDDEYGKEHGVREEDASSVSDAIARNEESGDVVLNDEEFQKYAWPGGYPVLYLASDTSVYCGKCAPRHIRDEHRSAFIHYEGMAETCADCGEETESAYGDPDEPDDEDSDDETPGPSTGTDDQPRHGACAS